jgi:hypothetical protein
MHLESVDVYPKTAADILGCDFKKAVSVGGGWTGVCLERNQKDRSTNNSRATLTIFSETQIEGGTEYIPEFVMIPANDASFQRGQLVPGGSTSRGAIHVVTDLVGATAVLHGAAGSVLDKCQTPCSFNDLVPSPYSVELQKEGYRSIQMVLRVVAGKIWEQKIGLDEMSSKVPPANIGLPHAEKPSSGLFVSSQPPGADVFINGAKQSGQTPVILPLAPGLYNLVLRLAGYEAYAGNIQVKDNIQTQLKVALNKK